jgi:hypothetical protein
MPTTLTRIDGFDGATQRMTEEASVRIDCGFRAQTVEASISRRRLPRLPGAKV